MKEYLLITGLNHSCDHEYYGVGDICEVISGENGNWDVIGKDGESWFADDSQAILLCRVKDTKLARKMAKKIHKEENGWLYVEI